MKVTPDKRKGCTPPMKHPDPIKKTVQYIGIGVLFAMLIFLVGFITWHWDALFSIFTSETPSDGLEEFIAGFGIWGCLILVLFQMLQIVVAFLPGEPIELVSGMMYGGFFGALLCLAGVVLGTYLVFFAVQKFGSSLIAAFHDEKKLKKLNHLSCFRSEKNAELLTFILFLIPGLPKDFFAFAAPLTPIRMHRFVLISTLGRAPGMLITTYAGKSLLEGNWILALVLYGLLGIGALIGLIYYRKLTKSEASSKAS